MREDLNHNDFADDVNGAKKGMDLHNEAKKRIHKMPVETIDSMGQRLLQRWVAFKSSVKGSFTQSALSSTELPSFSFLFWNNLMEV